MFQCIAEKLPFECLSSVKRELSRQAIKSEGVYLAYDSMGVARCAGRGQIFARLESHRKKFLKQLVYFSFYIIQSKNHERKLEKAVLRAAGPQMFLNRPKVGDGIYPGSVTDYEAGSVFFERQHRRGKRKARRRNAPIPAYTKSH